MKRLSVLVLSTLIVSGTAHATHVDKSIEEMAYRRPGRAIRLLRAKLAGREGRKADRWQWLLARAYFESKKYRDAIATAAELGRRWPRSTLVAKANFLRADAHAVLKEYKKADQIYLDETKKLVSPSRRQEVARAYLRIADEAFKPKSPDNKPNYSWAERFYGLALSLGLPDPKVRQLRYRIARCQYLRGETYRAIRSLRGFLKKFKEGPFVAEARFALGRAHQKRGNRSEARKAFRDFLDLHRSHKKSPEAAFHIIKTFRLPRPGSTRDLEQGVRSARTYLARYPGHKWAPKAALVIGESYYHRKRYEEAVAAYREVIRRYSRKAVAAADQAKTFGQKELARARVRLGSALRAQRKYPEAIRTWQAYLRDHPADRDWEWAQRAVLDVEFQIAAEYYLGRRYDQAKEHWEAFLTRYPLDKRNPKVMRMLGQLEYDRGRYIEAVRAWKALVSKYGSHSEGSRGHLEMAITLADKLGQFEDAMKELERVRGSSSWKARQRLETMRKQALALSVAQIFNASERPKVKVVQRNLPRLSVRLYRIDMEAYFRSTRRLDGVDKLDLALIAPDKIWEEKVKGFRKWKESTHWIRLPVKEPGVYALTVSGGKREATTVVHVSDLAMITKSSRRDLMVFAMDSRRQRPWPGARIIVATSDKIILEGKTGPDGVWHERDKALRNLSKYRIFAISRGHVAGTRSGYIAGAVRVLTPRGLVYTDRPAYKPGEKVNIRAIVRRVERGAFVFRAGERYTLTVSSPRGETLTKREVTLDDFGAMATAVSLDPNAPTGWYQVSLGRKKGPRFSGRFQVSPYRLEKVRLEIAFDRSVFMRGEKLRGVIRAKYQFGEPVAGKKVKYVLENEGIERDAILDKKGEARFSFKTRNYDWNQQLRIRASIPDEGVSKRAFARLATEEFVIKTETDRSVYLVGGEALVTVTARDVLDKPRSVSLNLDVLIKPPRRRGKAAAGADPLTRQARAEFSRPQGGEVRLRQIPVKIGPDGKAVIRVPVRRAGEMVFRARATDRFGNSIVSAARATVSGSDDVVRLRLFTARAEYRVGEGAKVEIHSRVASERVALVTFEAEGIVDHRVIRVRPGKNPLSFPINEEHAPNFRLAVALLDGPELRHAAADFRVRRGLRVEVKPDRRRAAPGEKVKVRLKVTDQNGKPARAAVSLAMVDEALYALFRDRTPGIKDFFYGQQRDIEFATAASRLYRHEAQSTRVSDELLKETERRAEEKREHFYKNKKKMARRSRSLFDLRPSPKIPASLGMGAFGSGVGGGGKGMAFGRRGARSSMKLGRVTGGRVTPPQIRARFNTLAFWAASLKTGADGTKWVSVALPDNATTWRLTARAVAVPTLVGEARGKVISRQDFFVETRFPRTLTEGDKVKPIVRVHNYTGKAAVASVKTQVTLGTTQVSRTGQVEAPGRGAGESALDAINAGRFTWGGKNQAVIETEARGAGRADRERITLPLRAWGGERRATASGSTKGSVTRTLDLGEGVFARRSLSIYLGPGPSRTLVSMALSRQGLRAASAASLAQWVLITHDVLQYLRSQGRGGPSVAKLEAQLESLSNSLVMAQRTDGGFAWAGKGSANPFVSGQALRALLLARKAGVGVPARALQRLVRYVGRQFREQRERRHDAKAALLYALAHIDDAKLKPLAVVQAFASANRLFRLRHGLSQLARAYLALTFDALGRKGEVRTLAQLISSKLGGSLSSLLRRPRGRWWRWHGWFRDRMTVVALVVDAIQRALPTSPIVRQGAAWLLRRRYGYCWYSPRLTQAAVQALSRYYARTRSSTYRYKVAVRVNDRPVRTIRVASNDRFQQVGIPAALIKDGKNKVQLDLSGRGTLTYSMVLSGFTKGVDPKGRDERLRITRHYRPSPRRFAGKSLSRGFSSVSGKFKKWVNKLTQLPVGERAEVRIELKHRSSARRAGFILVEEPLPAGANVDRDSISGSFLHYEIEPGRIVFLVDASSWRSTLYYELFGVFPGKYRVLPTRATGAYDPAFLATGKPAEMEVLEKGVASKDPYKPTPDENLALGRALFERKEYRKAQAPLERLLASHGSVYTIRDRIYRDVVKMLLYSALDSNKSDDVVRYFEILKERYPELVVPLDKSVDVARAYMAMGEHERALQVLRATVEASFNVESQIGGALDKRGHVIESARFVKKLIERYPDLSVVQNAAYGLAQHLVNLNTRAQKDPKLKKLKLERGMLLDDAIRSFWEFMALYPENPTVDEAGFALANAYLVREEHEDVISLTRRLRRLLPESAFVDSYEYLQGLAAFALERYEDALRMCRRVATGKYFDEKKRKVQSRNRELAVLIMAQIYHALGRSERALTRYKEVRHRFSDAREAVENFERVELSIPEVTAVAPGERASLKVRFRNVTKVKVTVYKVDLMKLYLIHRDLNNITKVKLAGIKPLVRRDEQLSGRKTYRDEKASIDLPLRKVGAYLVVLKSKEIEASGMILVSGLKLEVKTDALSGRVRVQVLNRRSVRPVRKVFVRVVGSSDGRFQGGKTDLRGVFAADGVSGRPTVIAAKGTAYAFYRGKGVLRRVRKKYRPRRWNRRRRKRYDFSPPSASPRGGLLLELQKQNLQIQQKARRSYERQITNEDRGVQLDKLR